MNLFIKKKELKKKFFKKFIFRNLKIKNNNNKNFQKIIKLLKIFNLLLKVQFKLT